MVGMPVRPSLDKKHAITIIRFSFQTSSPIARLKVDRKPLAQEWKSTISQIRSQDGWRYINLGNDPEDPTVALIIIGWLDSSPPAPLFDPRRQFEDGPILPHLQPHLSQPPDVMTLWHAHDRAMRTRVTTQRSSHRRAPSPPRHAGGIAEFVRFRGPAKVLETAIKDIALRIDYFNLNRFPVQEEFISHQFLFSGGIPFAVEDHEHFLRDAAQGTVQGQSELATFAFIFHWTGKSYRAEFKDPTVLDRGACSFLDADYSRVFWADKIEAPIRQLRDEHGVQVVSWDYKAHTPVAYNDAKASVQDGYSF